MGTGRLIGRSFWGFVYSDVGGWCCEGSVVGFEGESVGVWRWVVFGCLGLR